MVFTWSVGINITSTLLLETPEAEGGYGFSPTAIGYLYFTPIVGVILGEFFGHFFNDFVANRYIRTHNGHFKSEIRLTPTYLATLLMVPGLIMVGQALNKHLSYWVVVFGWGMYIFGVIIASVALSTYVLDSYPAASPEVAGLLNFARVLGGFTGKSHKSAVLLILHMEADEQCKSAITNNLSVTRSASTQTSGSKLGWQELLL